MDFDLNNSDIDHQRIESLVDDYIAILNAQRAFMEKMIPNCAFSYGPYKNKKGVFNFTESLIEVIAQGALTGKEKFAFHCLLAEKIDHKFYPLIGVYIAFWYPQQTISHLHEKGIFNLDLEYSIAISGHIDNRIKQATVETMYNYTLPNMAKYQGQAGFTEKIAWMLKKLKHYNNMEELPRFRQTFAELTK